MKKISYLLLILLLGFTVIACRENLSDVYSGESKLHFSKGLSSDQVIVGGTQVKEMKIPFGTLKGVSGSHKVSLVLDKENSTAVEGVDYDIDTNPIELTNGKFSGEFTVKLYEKAASSTKKKAVFKLSSPTLSNAIFDQTYSLGISLFCSVKESFVGNFAYNGFLGAKDIKIVEHPTKEKTLLIKDLGAVGKDIELTYDYEGNINFVKQETGYVNPTYGMVSIEPAKNKQSTFNTCTRELTLHANYTVAAGTFGDKIEKFIGK